MSALLLLPILVLAGGEQTAADAAATKLLSEARAARAAWKNFPGFAAEVTVNVNGKIAKAPVEVSAQAKVKLDLADKDFAWLKGEIASLVGHRMVSGAAQAPAVFADDNLNHPSGRLLRPLNEKNSSYRVRDKQLLEVNREMGDVRFTITVLKNTQNKEGQFLPAAFVVNTWDLKTNVLGSSRVHYYTWQRIGDFDLPRTMTMCTAAPNKHEMQQITFENIKLSTTTSSP